MVSTPLRRRVKRDLLLAAVVSGSALGIVFACLYPYAACVACVAAVAGRRSLRHASRRRLAALCAAVGASFLLYVLYLRLLAPGPAAGASRVAFRLSTRRAGTSRRRVRPRATLNRLGDQGAGSASGAARGDSANRPEEHSKLPSCCCEKAPILVLCGVVLQQA